MYVCICARACAVVVMTGVVWRCCCFVDKWRCVWMVISLSVSWFLIASVWLPCMDVDFAVCVASLFVNCAMSFDVVLYIRLCVYVCVLIHLFISPLRYVLIRSVNHLCFCFYFSFYLLQLLLLLTHSLTQHSICNAILFVCVLLMHSLSLSSLSLHRSLCFCAVIFPHHLSSILLLTYSINNPPPISLDKNIYLYISTYPQSNIYHPDSVNRARITAFSDHFKLLFLLIVNLIVYASPLCAPFLLFSFLPSFQVATKTTLLSEYATLYWAIPARCKESHFTIRNVSWLSVLCYVMCCVCVDWFFLSHHSLSLFTLHSNPYTISLKNQYISFTS